MKKLTALDIYRALTPTERADYTPPAGMRGAPAVRDLQEIAAYLIKKWPTPDRLNAMRVAYSRGSNDMSLHLIPLGDADSNTTRTAVREKNSRLQNWNAPAATTARRMNMDRAIVNEGQYSARCRYTHYTYTPMMLSAGRVSDDGSVLGAVINTGTYVLLAPRGYRWGVDGLGIRLYRTAKPADDFHPSSDDIRAGIRHIVARLRANAETRQQARRDAARRSEAEKRACAHGVWVSLEDSRRAGNCAAGTIAYCERHGFNRQRHYRAEVLLRAEDSHRVRLAIDVAKKRQIAEWERGYSDLPCVGPAATVAA